MLCCLCSGLQEDSLRSSSSPPNSTGSTADSDGWDSQRLSGSFPSPGLPKPCLPASRKSFGGFKRGPEAGLLDPSQLRKRPKSAGLLLEEGRRKTDKLLKKKKKKKLRKSLGDGSDELCSMVQGCSSPEFTWSGARAIKEEPEDFLSIPIPTAAHAQSPDHHVQSDSPGCSSSPCQEGLLACKEEPDSAQSSPSWRGKHSPEVDPKARLSDGEAVVVKVEGVPGTRTVFRQGKQVVFRDEDGSGDDEDIMVDSGMFHVDMAFRFRFSVCTSLSNLEGLGGWDAKAYKHKHVLVGL